MLTKSILQKVGVAYFWVMGSRAFWKEACKFLSGAFFVTAGASWYFAYYRIPVPFLVTSMTPGFLVFRGFLHFVLFLVTFYIGFVGRKAGRSGRQNH